MKYKKFDKFDFKKFHPSGSLGKKLTTVEDLMFTGKKIPLINENTKMKPALKIISDKKLGVLIVKNKKGFTTGICTDGDIKRAIQKNKNLNNILIREIMTHKPIFVKKNILAAKALLLMNEKKITSLCVNSEKIKNKTIGIIHIHQILESGVQ
jgi:arabinose-5-phosphate isomerase